VIRRALAVKIESVRRRIRDLGAAATALAEARVHAVQEQLVSASAVVAKEDASVREIGHASCTVLALESLHDRRARARAHVAHERERFAVEEARAAHVRTELASRERALRTAERVVERCRREQLIVERRDEQRLADDLSAERHTRRR